MNYNSIVCFQGQAHAIEKDVNALPLDQKIANEEKIPLNDDDTFGLKKEKTVGHAIFRSSFLSWIFETFRWFNNNFIDGSKHNNNCLCWCQLSGVMLYKWNSLLWRNVWISRAEKKRIDVIWCPWIRFFYLNSLRICVYVLLNFDNASLFNHF